ncbi:unnamed protein product [Arabis nemorensis]|uniref:Uncharacterized protein n=1 Tax=Arabis nemorensis TaxID=586526 RepID=A0A565B901_9BRAS|nr:unnamed protein product [Arabis nemorensis]
MSTQTISNPRTTTKCLLRMVLSNVVLVRIIWPDFSDGIVILRRLVLTLGGKDCTFDDRLLTSAIAKYKQVLKKLDDKLRRTAEKHVSDGNGFSRETIESSKYISDLWKSLFDEEVEARSRIISDLFQPILSGEYWQSEIPTLPVLSLYILGKDFAKEEMREEVARLGVKLSLYVADSMFLLCDDIRCMLRFCFKLWRDAKMDLTPCSPVVEKLLRVIHYVYLTHIKPKNGVYQIGGKSAHWDLILTTCWENFCTGFSKDKEAGKMMA